MKVSFISAGQFPLTGMYTQDFSNLGISSLLNVPGGDLNGVSPGLNGWYFLETGMNNNTDIIAGDGTGSQGDTYNYGTSAAADRALGGVQSGSLVPYFGFYFLNNTGNTITSITVTYTGEQWRLGTAGRPDRLDFQYSQNATGINNGLWLDLDVLDFTAPVTTGTPRALNGNANPNRVQLSITISGLFIPVSGSFILRWVDFNTTGAEDGLGVDDVSIVPGFTPGATGYFRSAGSGEWTHPQTWEYSEDNISWVASTFIPTATAGSIIIRNAHQVVFQAFLPVDEIEIQNGGLLDHRNGLMNITDGSGNDINIRAGGVLVLSSGNNPPTFGSVTPVVNIQTAGILRVAAGGLTSLPGAGVHASNFVYHHQSILEFVLPTAFGTVGVTYFPNAGPATIPVFRITQPIGVSVGSVSPTIINGVFEANGNVTFANSGTKTFRNGIRGTGNINGSNSGKFIINGVTAELGGNGSLVLPTSGGLEIGSPAGTMVNMISGKMMTGNVHLLNTGSGAFIETGIYNLSVNGMVTGGSGTSYIRTTNSVGSLTLRNVGIMEKWFPLGESSYNPLSVSVASGTADFTVRVRTGIFDPGGAIPTDAVSRTWYVHANTVTHGVTMKYQYGTQPGELSGTAIVQPASMELLQSDYTTWHLAPGNTAILSMPTPGPSFTVTTATTLTINNSPVPYALGTSGTVFLAPALVVKCEVNRSVPSPVIDFCVNDESNILVFEIERSAGNGAFSKQGAVLPQPDRKEYRFTDASPAQGTSYYRVKALQADSSICYSNTVTARQLEPAGLQVSLYPNPVHSGGRLSISSMTDQEVVFMIFSAEGRLINKWVAFIPKGNSSAPFRVESLPAGSYYLTVHYQGSTIRIPFSKQ